MKSMKLCVRLFARARDIAGRDVIDVDVGEPITVSNLRRRLAAQYPALAALLERSALAIDKEFAEDDRIVSDGAEVALLPPVSGGSI